MISRIFYLAVGFAVGYFIDTLRRGDQESGTLPDSVAEIVEAPNRPTPQAQVPTPVAPSKVEKVEFDSPKALTQINGIGPTYAKRLFDAGIRSFSALANANPDDLAQITNVLNSGRVEDWIEQAKSLGG